MYSVLMPRTHAQLMGAKATRIEVCLCVCVCMCWCWCVLRTQLTVAADAVPTRKPVTCGGDCGEKKIICHAHVTHGNTHAQTHMHTRTHARAHTHT